MNEIGNIFWYTVQGLIGINLVLPLLLYLIYGFKSGKRSREARATAASGDYGIIVTAYEQTDLLPDVVSSLLELNYDRYMIYVVADNCDISNLHFNSERVVLLRPERVLASNVRSHFYAIQRFRRPHNRLTIIDSDNLVDNDYLNQLDRYFDRGYEAVQGIRAAKNLDTVFARLDAARDAYYHFYDGKVLFNAGSSATLAGSGMAFTVKLYRECLEQLDVAGAGFDKVLQYEIVRRGKRIAFTDEAIVYDQKTSYSNQLVKQRARWINTWFKYFRFGFDLLRNGIGTFNWNQILFGTILLRPPLFIFLLLSVLCLVINAIIEPAMAAIWLGAMMLFVLGFFIAMVASRSDARIYRALLGIPSFMFYQIVSLTKAAAANKLSVATRHGQHRGNTRK